jgi:signal peptidase II
VDLAAAKRRWSTLWLSALVVLADQVTKHWAVNHLVDGKTIDLVWTLRFKLGFNSGMAFSQAEGLGPVIGVIALVAIVVLAYVARQADTRSGSYAAAAILGGAAGNVVDRLFRGDGWLHGSVVDFIDLQWWPVFNIADMAITIGGAILVIGAWRTPRESAASGAAT